MMTSSADLEMRLEHFEGIINKFVADKLVPDHPLYDVLARSMTYSLTSGGKRFRPMLVYLTAEAFGVGPERVAPWALAIEMVHTYSLIHDDLPCMDNDDMRRGKPTNHKVFGESIALLAGDALLTEAFALLVDHYQNEPALAMRLVQLLSRRVGFNGMVGGQTMDMQAKNELRDESVLIKMQRLKTGALIKASIEGTALVLGLVEERQVLLAEFGEHLGLAFQLADDLLDSQEGVVESGSLVEKLGLFEVQKRLLAASTAALQKTQELGISASQLARLVEYNQNRNK